MKTSLMYDGLMQSFPEITILGRRRNL